MKEFIDYLERKIEGCDSLGGMEREKAVYQSVLKDYRKQFAISDVVVRSEQLVCHHCNKYKRLQGNGMIHQLCECGEQAN